MSDLPLVVMCSNTPFDSNPLGAKPLADALSKSCLVLYVDPPLSYATAIFQPSLRSQIFSKRFRQISESMYRLTPVVLPGKDKPFIYKITSFITKKRIHQAIKKIQQQNGKPMLIATAPHYRLFSNKTFNVYWMMDDYASQPELTGINKSVLNKGQQYLASNSDTNIAVSEALKQILKNKGYKSVVIQNGADAEIFNYPCSDQLSSEIANQLPAEPFAIYVGGITNRIDIRYFEAIAKAEVPLVIAGGLDRKMDVQAFSSLANKKSVTYLGSIDNAQIPALMNRATLGLVPYADVPFNRSSMPLKIPEYLLCGLIVVSTKLPFTKEFDSEDLFSEKSVKAFQERVSSILSNPPTDNQRRLISNSNTQIWSWDKKAEQYLAVRN